MDRIIIDRPVFNTVSTRDSPIPEKRNRRALEDKGEKEGNVPEDNEDKKGVN